MVSVEDREQIRRAYFIEGKGIRAIAEKFGHGRRVVRQAIASADPPRYQRQQPPAAPILGPYKERIEQLLADNEKLPRKQRYTGQHIYKELCKAGYQGGESTVVPFSVDKNRGGLRLKVVRRRAGLWAGAPG